MRDVRVQPYGCRSDHASTPLTCDNCIWKDSHGTVTFGGEVVREGTVCELDSYCWGSKTPWADMESPPTQPLAARHVAVDDLLGLNKLEKDTRREFWRTPFG